MRLAACIAIFCLPILAGVLKHTVFGGVGPIWPFFLAACAVAAIYDWKSALLVAIGVGGAQYIERSFEGPEILQFGLYSVLAFVALWFTSAPAAATLAIVAMMYIAAAVTALAWFPAVVASEFVLTFGLIWVVVNGPGGGLLSRVLEAPSPRNQVGIASVSFRGRGDPLVLGEEDRSVDTAQGGR